MSRKLYLGVRPTRSFFAKKPVMFPLQDVPRENMYEILSYNYDEAIANAYDRHLMSQAHDEQSRDATEEHLMDMWRFIHQHPDAEFYAE